MSLHRYIWVNSRREQLILFAIILSSLPFYFLSLQFPKIIVNEVILGSAFERQVTAHLFEIAVPLPKAWGGNIVLWEGLEFTQLPYLFATCATFLLLIGVNSGFQYVIGLRRKRVGTAMTLRLREELTQRYFNGRPETTVPINPAEIAVLIRGDTEPVGAYAGDAFASPMVQIGHAAVAITFIVIQSPLLGVLAIVMLGGLFEVVVPRLGQREQKMEDRRRLVSGRLSGHLNDMAEGLATIRAERTFAFEMARIRGGYRRFAESTDMALAWTIIVQVAMSTVAQLSRLSIFVVGGWLALAGMLDIGRLVAVLNAYRDLPDPVTNFLHWSHRRHDAEQRFAVLPDILGEARTPRDPAPKQPCDLASGRLEARAFTIENARGLPLLEGLDLSIPLPAHIALVDRKGEAGATLAALVGNQLSRHTGTLLLASTHLKRIAPDVLAQHLSYVGPSPHLFELSVRHNMAYGLFRKPNDTAGADWIDYGAAGVEGSEALDQRMLELLTAFGVAEDFYASGLGTTLPQPLDAITKARIVAGRKALHEAIDKAGLSELVEPLDSSRYIDNAELLENLLFGRSRSNAPLGAKELLGDAGFMRVLRASGLDARLADAGLHIARQIIAMYGGDGAEGIPPGQSKLVRGSELPVVRALAESAQAGGLNEAGRKRLIGLTFSYVEPRHRLGALDDDLRGLIVEARSQVHAGLPAVLRERLHLHDPDAFCEAASIRDNLLFARIVHRVAGAQRRVDAVLADAVESLGLVDDIQRAGLDLPARAGDQFVSQHQQVAICLARALIKRPTALVLNGALRHVPGTAEAAVIERIHEEMEGRTLIAAMDETQPLDGFDVVVRFSGARLLAIENRSKARSKTVLDMVG
jgi:putative ABC transport system ATP-binding protein